MRQFVFIYFLIFITIRHENVYALEATFTASPDKDTGSTDGPLPQSQNQRDQLTKLDQVISQSDNPMETLQKIASSNGMEAEELGELLMRNRRDMEMVAGSSVGGMGRINSLPIKMVRLLSTLALLGINSAKAHPRSASFIILTCISILYVTLSAPRNGVLISFGNMGYTTLFPPPVPYLKRFLTTDKFLRLRNSVPEKKKVGSLTSELSLEEYHDGVHQIPLSKKQKKSFDYVVTARKSIPREYLLPSEDESLDIYETVIKSNKVQDMDEDEILNLVENKARDERVELAFSSAQKIMKRRRFSEFISTRSQSLQFISSSVSEMNNAAIVLESMGVWKRYLIQPLRIVSTQETEDLHSISFHTLGYGHFDGELQISIEKSIDKDAIPSISVIITLLIPKKGRSIHSSLASKMVSILAESIVTSTITDFKQSLSRRLQSSMFKGKAKSRATEKRLTVSEKLKDMEELVSERRRRWKRNGDSGSYRPSGRMSRLDGKPKFN